MSYRAEREQFIVRMTKEGLDLSTTLALLRAATTIQRYAELACSSEAADRDRVPCPGILAVHATRCICDDWPVGTHAAGRHSLVPRIDVRALNTKRNAEALAAEHGLKVITQGDPRGYVLRVVRTEQYREDRYGGADEHGPGVIGVPA